MNTECQNDFKVTSQTKIKIGYFEHLKAAGFINGFSCRVNGKSVLVPGTLNLALHVGDDKNFVLENRKDFAEVLGIEAEKITTAEQVHGSEVAIITEALIGSGALDFQNTIKGTDALVTNIPNVPLMLFYADCVPVVFADPVKKVCGIAHAGWRGTVAEIAVKTAKVMIEKFGCNPEDILAGIGPSIGACCYEVDDFVRDQAPSYTQFFEAKGEGKYWLDLWGVNKAQLLQVGLNESNIGLANICTNDNHDLFCSYRAEAGKTGRMGVCVSIK